MPVEKDRQIIREVIEGNRYLTLSTTDGATPWIAPLEYFCDDEYNFYVFSVDSSRHAQHIAQNPAVAIAIFDQRQSEYLAGESTVLRGVQVEAEAQLLSADEYPEPVLNAINALQPPMPPYEVFKLKPVEFYVPKIVDGVNKREHVDMDQN